MENTQLAEILSLVNNLSHKVQVLEDENMAKSIFITELTDKYGWLVSSINEAKANSDRLEKKLEELNSKISQEQIGEEKESKEPISDSNISSNISSKYNYFSSVFSKKNHTEVFNMPNDQRLKYIGQKYRDLSTKEKEKLDKDFNMYKEKKTKTTSTTYQIHPISFTITSNRGINQPSSNSQIVTTSQAANLSSNENASSNRIGMEKDKGKVKKSINPFTPGYSIKSSMNPFYFPENDERGWK